MIPVKRISLRMTDPRAIAIDDYNYELPDDRIAQYPLAQRDASKLLVYKNGTISDRVFRELPEELPAGSIAVFNTTKVVRARMILQRESGARIELFCTDAADRSIDFSRILHQTGQAEIRAFVGNAKRWKEQETLTLQHDHLVLKATKVAPVDDQWKVLLQWTPDLQFSEVLDIIGNIPLPPYMNREEEEEDQERYQTVFAQQPGSVAAPTAGLHFTEHVLQQLRDKKISTAEVCLHVGAGTFKPVKSDTMEDHIMHREQIVVSYELIEQLIAHHGQTVIAVGTTALRTLESLYWFGRQLVLEPGRFHDQLFVDQWDPYQAGPDVNPVVALRTIKDWMREYNRNELRGYTQLLIAPGYQFKIANALITNFHQPRSTLLLLVAAFTNNNHQRIYQHALDNNYRFLSYGDSSLLFR
jgi:S-adenosylmethionine:tRNA ribosyltransferase-isomerase